MFFLVRRVGGGERGVEVEKGAWRRRRPATATLLFFPSRSTMETEKLEKKKVAFKLTDSVGGCTCRGLSNGLCGGCWMKPERERERERERVVVGKRIERARGELKERDRSKFGHRESPRLCFCLSLSLHHAFHLQQRPPLFNQAQRMRIPGAREERGEKRAREGVINEEERSSKSNSIDPSSPEPTMATFGLSIRIVAWSMRSCSVSCRCVYILGKREREREKKKSVRGGKRTNGGKEGGCLVKGERES